MSFWKNLFNRSMSNRAAGSGTRFFFGPSTAGKTVNEHTALQIAAVYGCVRVLAESVASLPLQVFEETEGGNRRKALDNRLYFLLHDEPNPEMTSATMRETMMAHILLFGNAYAQIIRNGRGEVLALYPLMPNRVSMERDDKTGQLYYRYSRYDQEPPTMEGNTVILMPEDVLHIPGMAMDGLVGMSPIAACRNVVGAGLAADEYSSMYFAHGAAPMGTLEHPGTLKNPEKLRENWTQVYGGTRNAGRVAVLEEGMKFTPISISPQDSQLLETRKFTVEEICRIFRVPPHMVQSLDRATFSNIEQLSLDFVMYSLMPYLKRWEQALTKSLLNDEEKKRYFIRFNVDGLLRGDYKSRMEGYSIGINNGFLSPNDVRALEGLDMIPAELGGDRFLVQGSMIPLDKVGAPYVKQDSGKAADKNDDKPVDPAEGSEHE